jgi:ATP-dependent DNA helicase
MLQQLLEEAEISKQEFEESQKPSEQGNKPGRGTTSSKRGRGRGRGAGKTQTKLTDFVGKNNLKKTVSDDDAIKTDNVGIQELQTARQPKMVTGGTMRKYQLEGLQWLVSLFMNGVNGILADEMGLGKTIQTISLLAYLMENDINGPFLVVAPLSTLTNWIDELSFWTPTIPSCLYHGSKDERKELRETVMVNPGSKEFPIVVTSYNICMNDRKFLDKFNWRYIIIDEGHRLKNVDSKLIRELSYFNSENRLLITGTPLQNDLSELWSLLHFLQPNVFNKWDDFEAWFDFSDLADKSTYENIFTEDRKKSLVSSLHDVLRPYLLRRVKRDVGKMLPKKREYVIFAPLTEMQRDLYGAILDGSSRTYLTNKVVETLSMNTPLPIRTTSRGKKRKSPDSTGLCTPAKSARTSRDSTPASSLKSAKTTRSGRKVRKSYAELSDKQFFDSVESSETAGSEDDVDVEAKQRADTFTLAKKLVANKKLQNPDMQLRLCCNSPHNFFNPFIQPDGTPGTPDESLVAASGKMLLLDQLLPALFKDGHKVLIFSQFKLQLDILEDYAALRGWKYCRIDGSVAQQDRADQIKKFNTPPNQKTAANLFLLTTRAGGQGINLTAADTVILFDSDWNPQQDLQAQDRAHRIGQTRNVIVYRLATRNTIEEKLLEAAEGKRRLEKLVIKKGGVTADDAEGQSKALAGATETLIEELRQLLRKSDGEKFSADKAVIGPEELAILTDRSDEAYVRAEKGMDRMDAFKTLDIEKLAAGELLERLET